MTKEEFTYITAASAVSVLFGIFLLLFSRKNLNGSAKTAFLIISYFFTSMGASLFICGVFRSEKLLALCVFAFAGLLAYISAISIRKSAGFNVPVAAEYIGLEAFSLRGREHFIPQFRYTHKNETVTASEIRSYSKSKCEKLFREGEKYTVYIKPSARGQCSYGKKFPPYLFILPALSALFAVLSVIILIFV